MRRLANWIFSLVLAVLLIATWGCTAGSASSTSEQALTTAASATSTQAQQKIPVDQLQIYVDGYHNAKAEANLPAERQHQMRVAHFCQSLSPDLIQCAVYDGNGKSAHLIGLEHIISDSAFQGLPAGEKKYWHPHDGEVDTGMLDMAGAPEAEKQSVLKTLRSTHGKTWHVGP